MSAEESISAPVPSNTQRAASDPGFWGRHYWTTLCLARTNDLVRWRRMISALPYVLPCGVCRSGSTQFLKNHPLGMVKTTADTQMYLTLLRHHSGRDEGDPHALDRFYKRAALPLDFRLLDLALTMYSSLMTIGNVTLDLVLQWVEDVIELHMMKHNKQWFTTTQPDEQDVQTWCLDWLRRNGAHPTTLAAFRETASVMVFEPLYANKQSISLF